MDNILYEKITKKFFKFYLCFKNFAMKKKLDPELKNIVEQTLEEIGARLRNHRKAKSKNHESFASETGFNRTTVLRAESGKNLNLKTLIEMLYVLEIPIEDFFKGLK